MPCRSRLLPLFVVLIPGIATPAAATPEDDAFVVGYASAVLRRELGIERARVSVRDGAVRVEAERIPAAEREKLAGILGEIPGVVSVDVAESGAALPSLPGAAAAPPSVAGAQLGGLEILPERELFAPLLADPRWPHFAAAAHFYLNDDELAQVAAVSFGEAVPLLGFDAPGGRGELSLHAAVFSIFDLDSESFDLVNSDFLVGLAAGYRRGRFSALLRLIHQSSHLGDEFLLRSRVDRVNLSYEALRLLLSWDLGEALRVYGGGGTLLRRDPGDLERGFLQAGLEWRSPDAYLGDVLRPLAAVDVQSAQESGWTPDVSLRAGVQLESPRLFSQRLQLLLEYYSGRSPNGQFFERDIDYLGLGAHLHF